MAWIDKFKKTPLLTNEDMLSKMNRIDASAEWLISICITGTPQHTQAVAYQEMMHGVRKLLMLYIDKGEEVPPKFNRVISKFEVSDPPKP